MIRTNMTHKVIEQAHDGSGCGAVLASFTDRTGGADAARARALQLAKANPGTRYYVAGFVSGVYQDGTGGVVIREYAATSED